MLFSASWACRKFAPCDHSGYEGAEIIHDLNRPIPAHLENTADFILDGSTLDNLFSPSIAIQSIARMLRAGRRLSFRQHAKLPLRLVFADKSLLVPRFFHCERFRRLPRLCDDPWRSQATLNVYAVDPTARRDRAFRPLEVTGLMVFAEKATNSTWEAIPSQRYYSAGREIEKRVAAGQRFAANSRPELLSFNPSEAVQPPAPDPANVAGRKQDGGGFSLGPSRRRRVNVPASWTFSLARMLRRLEAWRSGRR